MGKMLNGKVPQIFKLQRSIVSSHEIAQILVYNQSQTVMAQFDATPELLLLFPKDVYKVYATGTVDITGHINVEKVIEDREW